MCSPGGASGRRRAERESPTGSGAVAAGTSCGTVTVGYGSRAAIRICTRRSLTSSSCNPWASSFVPLLRELIPYFGLTRIEPLGDDLAALLADDRLNVIVHPTTSGHAKRWKLESYGRLIESLPEDRYRIFITGTGEDAELIGDGLPFERANVTSLLGRLTLGELFGFVSRADALVSASTGRLHIAAALGKCAIGIFTAKRIAHPGRFAPIGRDAHALVYDPNCKKCLDGLDCDCLEDVPPDAVVEILEAAVGRAQGYRC